jgi:lysophosphatidylcholine acyltransferase/lyso-PAF acetyltransferase
MKSAEDNPSQFFEDDNPFVRRDRYGELGLTPQPLHERVRLLLLALFLVPLKLAGTLACLLSYFAVIKVSFLFPENVRSEWVATLGKIHCRICLFCLGFVRVRWVTVGGEANPTPATPVVGIVSNHTSWVDILVHMSHSFPAFVARDATKYTPIIGSIRYENAPAPFQMS